MLDDAPAANSAVYLLADHLDAALAAGEDLLVTRLPALADLDQTEDAAERELSRFVARLKRLEASLVGRLLQARRRIAELPRQDAEFKPIERLFTGGTAVLLDMVGELADPSNTRFETGLDRLPFLRERGLLARDAGSLPLYETLDVTESFRVGAKIELGPLLDMTGKLLDALDNRYDLYGEGLARRPADATGDAGSDAAAVADLDEASGNASSGAAADRPAPDDPGTGAETAPAGGPSPPLTPSTLAAALQQIERGEPT